ncbi:hypothetical protein LAZ67_15002016 [Cordylochernes scorpioides]|uniref:Tc1-like transposase DDE domain-containing protein n=1 Tax=Cordylochernes scorpioides TaxID=51811 RepID=A0ABY6L997_9ARAC|nr:hypothetical protein LAZ67_15002016 [Cordylochernes scorpioides]
MPGHRKRRQFKQTDAFTRGMVIGLKRAVIDAVYACGVDVEKGPIRQQLCNAPPCDNVESWFGAQSRMIPGHLYFVFRALRRPNDVLRPVTLPYLQGVPNALYQQDNARPHTARISQQALQDVQMLPWPPYSPDLSPIEHVWDIIGRRLHALPQPRSEDELWQMVEREWRAIPQDAIRTLIDSLPRRVAACIAVRGVHVVQAIVIMQFDFALTNVPEPSLGWVFGHGLDDDALAILASARTRIYRYFLGVELRSVQEDLVWSRTLSRSCGNSSFSIALTHLINEFVFVSGDSFILVEPDQQPAPDLPESRTQAWMLEISDIRTQLLEDINLIPSSYSPFQNPRHDDTRYTEDNAKRMEPGGQSDAEDHHHATHSHGHPNLQLPQNLHSTRHYKSNVLTANIHNPPDDENFSLTPSPTITKNDWVFGHGLDDDALANLASAKTLIYRYFLGVELRSEDLVWRRTLSRFLALKFLPCQKRHSHSLESREAGITARVKLQNSEIELRHKRKLEFWQVKYGFPLRTRSPSEDTIVNLTDIVFSDKQISLLEKGLSFRLPNEPDLLYTISCIESSLQHQSHTDKHHIRSTIANKLLAAYKSSSSRSNSVKSDLAFLKALKRHHDILITKSDKGSQVVVLKVDDYKKKMSDILSDSDTFQEISPERVCAISGAYKSSLRLLRRNECITPDQFQHNDQKTILDLFTICLDTNALEFNGCFFVQMRGSPMGSPLSTIAAEIVMSNLDRWVSLALVTAVT